MAQENKREFGEINEQQIEQIRQIAKNIRYGTITLVFQDGILIQIDRSEKIRLTNNPS